MAPRHHQRRGRNSGRFWRFYAFAAVLVAAAAIFLGCVVFFKVNDVEVWVRNASGMVALTTEEDHYTTEEVMEAGGIRQGDNLILIRKNRIAAGILQKLPYVSNVSIRRKLPGTLVLTISQSEAAAAIQYDKDHWWLIDDNGRLLEESPNSRKKAILTGLLLLDPQVGQSMQVPDGTEPEQPNQQLQKESLLKLFRALREQNLMDLVVTIDTGSEGQLVMDYGGWLTVRLPINGDYSYQMRVFSKMLTDYFPQNWSQTDTGTLDMTFANNQPHLKKNS